MSWQVKDTTTELIRLRAEVTKIRDALFIVGGASNLPSSARVGGQSGQGAPQGQGNTNGLIAIDPAIGILTDVDAVGTPTGVFDKLNLINSTMIVDAVGAVDLRFIQGTLADGQIVYLKPLNGKVLTLKTGGNIDIVADVTVLDNQCAIIVFFEDNVTPDVNGNYVVATVTSGAGATGYNLIQDEGIALPAQTTIDFQGAGVIASNGAGKTIVTISGAGAGLLPDLSNLASPTVPVKGIEMNGNEISELLFLQSLTSEPGTVGLLRVGNNQVMISARNATNTGNVELKYETNDFIDWTRDDNLPVFWQLRAQNAVFPDASFVIEARHLGTSAFATLSHGQLMNFDVGVDRVFDIRAIGTGTFGTGKFVFDPDNIGLVLDMNDKILFRPQALEFREFGLGPVDGRAISDIGTGLGYFFENALLFHKFFWTDSGAISRNHMEVGIAGIFGGNDLSTPAIIRWHIKAKGVTQIGFQVTNELITNNVGTEGSMQIEIVGKMFFE